MSAGRERALAQLHAHPRHLLLAALVAGMLSAGAPPIALVAATAFAAVAARRPGLALAAAAAVLAGASLAHARLAAVDRTVLDPWLGHDARLRVTLLEAPRRSPSGARSALVRIVAGPGRGERVLLRTARQARWPAVGTGAELALRAGLVRLGPHDSFQRRRGAHAVALTRALRATGGARGGLAGLLDRVRRRAERAVGSGLDPPRAALARGMVLGEDEALTEPVRQDFRTSGLAHLLAASGQNVMLLAALALPLLALAGFGRRARLAGALALVALYVPLAGAGPSIQRAGVMGACGLLAALAGRPASRVYALLLAAAVTLAVNPRAAGDPGWQLSFAAVIAILVLSPRLRDRLVSRRVPLALAEATAITAAATAGTAPLLAFHFGRLSLVSLPVNVLAAVAVAPVMWLGMLSAAIGAIAPPVAPLVNVVAQYPLAYVGWLAHASAALPGAALPVRIGSVAALAAVYAAVVVFAVVRRARAPALAVAVTAVAAALAHATGGGVAAPDPRFLRVSFLDIGQGDATLLQHAGATVLVDTGPPGSPLLRRLQESGVRRVDVLVVTHAQSDHEGGAAAVIDRYRVGLLLDGGDGIRTPEHRQIVAAALHHRVRRATPDAGQTIRAGSIALHILWPHAEAPELHAGLDPNQRAIVADAGDGTFHMLLTADAESDVTAPLDLPRVDALKVAHHGSEDPGLADELARLRPRIAVIEVGRHNTYGHPTAQALAALRSVPEEILRTDRDGTVRLTVRGRALTVSTGA